MSIPSPFANCQQATLLVERRADEALPFPTRAQLWAHLRLCPYCRRYAVQSRLIARHAKLTAVVFTADLSLPVSARARLQQLLDDHATRS